VVASNRSSIPEFSDPSTLLIDPASTGEFVEAITKVLSRAREDGAGERRRFAAQFTWPRTAAAAIEAIEAASLPAVVSNTRYRIAWVSPLPPTRSGIGDYSRELLDHLPGEAFDIELVVSAQAVIESALASRYRVIHEHDVHARHAAAPFDLFVYHVGNSDLHVYVLDLMRRYSGLVVLHEVFLGGLALNASEVGHWPAGVAPSIEAEGNLALAAEARRGEIDHARIVEAVTMNRPLLVYAEAILVHNGWSWTRVRAVTDVPVFHIQHGIPERARMTREEARRLLGLPGDAFLVTTLGEVRASKHVDRIIEAISTLPERIRAHAQLLVVGDGSDEVVASLHDLVARLGLGDRVRFVGRVPLDMLGTYGCAADACVQLRHPVRGETSGALLRALAAGSACILSDAGSLSEVGRHAALFVPPDEGEVVALHDALVQIHDEPAVGERLRHEALSWIRNHHSMTDAGYGYAAAMSLTIARRRQQDGEWRDTAARALAAAGDAAVSGDAATRWADVHEAMRRTHSDG
jgi:glycosyltransferase involved in cell wall biosynthesis